MIIIKIGGGEKINIEGIAKDLLDINEELIVVHGANNFRDSLAEKLKINKKILNSVSGYSSVFSDENAIDLLMMAYAGYKNKRIVEALQRLGLNAIGLSGLDGRLIQGRRNQGIRVKEEEKLKIVRDLSGKPISINKKLLTMIIENNYIPIITVPIVDEDGYAINSENDDIVALMAREMNASKIIHLIEAPGLLLNDNDKNPVKSLSLIEIEKIEENSEGGIKRKMLSIKNILQASKIEVIISDGRVESPIKSALAGEGTIIK